LAGEQRARLAGEGVVFRADGTLDLAEYGWQPEV
jgi:methylated-DNA-protein-cysteine methyltransferase-like protein